MECLIDGWMDGMTDEWIDGWMDEAGIHQLHPPAPPVGPDPWMFPGMRAEHFVLGGTLPSLTGSTSRLEIHAARAGVSSPAGACSLISCQGGRGGRRGWAHRDRAS